MSANPNLVTLTLIVKNNYTGETSKLTRQYSAHEDAAEVIAILREMLLGLGYQPGTLNKYIKLG